MNIAFIAEFVWWGDMLKIEREKSISNLIFPKKNEQKPRWIVLFEQFSKLKTIKKDKAWYVFPIYEQEE